MWRSLAQAIRAGIGDSAILSVVLFALAVAGLSAIRVPARIEITIAASEQTSVQIYIPVSDGYEESRSKRFVLEGTDTFQTFVVRLPSGQERSRLRFDPLEHEGSVKIKEIAVKTAISKIVIHPSQFKDHVLGTQQISEMGVSDDGYLVITSTGNDPQIELDLPSIEQRIHWSIRFLLATGLAAFGATCFAKRLVIAGWLRSSMQKTDESPKLFGFLCAGLLFCGYSLGYYDAPPFFCCDAQNYWELSQAFYTKSGFAFDSFTNPIRGYLLPFLLLVIRSVADWLGVNEFRVFFAANAVITAFCVAVLIPLVFERITGFVASFWRVLAFSTIFFYFWRGFLIYPMGDTWSLFLVFLAVFFLHKALADGTGFACLVVSGAFLGMALNIRPVYVASPMMLLVVLSLRPKASVPLRVLQAFALVFGLMLPLLPQIRINAVNFSTYSPTVQTSLAYKGADLYLTQLFFGLSVQRHECALFVDNQGDTLLKANGIDNFVRQGDTAQYKLVLGTSYRDYLGMAFKEPLTFVGIYARHVVNGIAVFGDNIYECSHSVRKMLVSFSVWFVGLLCLWAAFKFNRLSSWKGVWMLGLPILPALLTIPTAMEARYFLPIHLVVYALVTLISPQGDLLKYVLINRKLVGAIFVIGLIVYVTQIGQLYATMYVPDGEMGEVWHLKLSPRTL